MITLCYLRRDHGDCLNVLDIVLGKGGLGKLDKQQGFMKQAMYGGIVVGLFGGLCAMITLCYLRRKRKKMQLTNRKYTPYGETDDGIVPDLDPSAPDTAEVIGDDK